MDVKYIEACGFLSRKLSEMLLEFPRELQGMVREVCLRTDKPVIVVTFDGYYFLKNGGGFSKNLSMNPYILSKEDMLDCIKMLTQYSLHSYKDEINSGFITVKGGHRAGVIGSCLYESAGSVRRISGINDISSINMRIARQIKGVAASLVKELYKTSVFSTLIAGPPASGKTTLLRDMACCFSNGTLPFSSKLALIDERGELAAVYRGEAQNDVGIMTDVFDGYKKGDGMAIAIRSMSPRIIMLDEISGEEDIAGIEQSLNAGVSVIATVHAGSLDEIYRKKHICSILASGGFEKIVLLSSAQTPCKVKEILSPKELTMCLV